MRTAYKLGVLIMTGLAGMAAIAWVAHDGGAVRLWLLILTTATAATGWGMLWITRPHLLEQDKGDEENEEDRRRYLMAVKEYYKSIDTEKNPCA
jgi:hypothetical protein|tara:strand:+ start:48 stop:329 length:282 start_codon:yes stop_codon:yes gene_type:complete